MLSKVLASRTGVGIVLVVIIGLNLLFATHHEKTTTVVNSKEGLDQAIDLVMSDDYSAALKQEILDEKKVDLTNQIKAELKKEYIGKVTAELRKDLEPKLRESVSAEIRAEVEKKITTENYNMRNLNYELLSEMKGKFYIENKERFEKMIQLEALQEVLASEENNDDLQKKVIEEINFLASRKEWFGHVLRDYIQFAAPKMGALSKGEQGPNLEGCQFSSSSPIYDKQFLSRVKFSNERMADFSSNHEKLVQKLFLMDSPSNNIFRGEGIVISGGGAYMAGALVAIVQVREVGSKLPIELIINSREEYDAHTCETLGKKFNFKCVVIEDEIGKELLQEMKIKKFQLKILGLLVTSFDHVIALDADNMPLMNPDLLLSSKAYMETEFLLWPDLWQRTISSSYYEIAGFKQGEPVRRDGLENGKDHTDYLNKGRDKVHYHDLDGLPSHVSTETGQMVYSMRKHYRAFILALYYNIYGDSHYWRMFYQGSPGDGDRDTFVPALHVFNEPYHVVERATWLAGFKRKENTFQETTIVQYDPETSQKYDEAWKKWLISKNMDSRMSFNQANQFTRDLVKEFESSKLAQPKANVFFLHVHRPKINPILATDPDGYYDWDQQRNLGKPGTYKNDFGETDWDLKFYTIAHWVACSGLKSPEWWEFVERDQKKVCEAMTHYMQVLAEDSEDKNAQTFVNVKLD